MAVVEGDPWVWLGRLQQAEDMVGREVRWLGSYVDRPFRVVLLMAADDLWGGPFADQLRGVLGSFDSQLVPWVEHLTRFRMALERLVGEAEAAARAAAAGSPVAFDPVGALAGWRAWPLASQPLPSDWALPGGRPATFVFVYPDRARQLAVGLRHTAVQLRGCRGRLAEVLTPLRIEAPPCFEPLAVAAETVAGEVDRRVAILEDADRRVAGSFGDLGAGLGFPGSLAPPPHANPDDPIGSAIPGAPVPPGAGPGRQPSQATEADPVSVATGNCLHAAVDLAMGGRGLPTVFVRTYNSLRAGEAGPLGFGWSTNFGAHLNVDEGVVVRFGDGREEHHSRGPEGTFVAPPGSEGRLQADSGGFVLRLDDGARWRFDRSGRLRTMLDLSGNETILEYDDGRLHRVRDAAGRVTVLEHDEAGRMSGLVDCLGGRSEYRYEPGGDLEAVTDPCGGEWAYRYDDAHRLTAVTDPEGRAVVTNVYDRAGRVVAQRDGAGSVWRYLYGRGRTVVTDPLGAKTIYENDSRFRTVAVTDPLGALTRLAWDEADRLSEVVAATGERSGFSYDEEGRLVEAAGPGSAPVRFEWDAADNLIAVVSATGERALLDYDEVGRPVRFVSPAGVETLTSWRADGLLESTVAGDGGTTRYGYDNSGHLQSVTDALGATTTVRFDAAGRPVAEEHPGGAPTTFGWDAMGRLTRVGDAEGGVTNLDYDRSGLLVAVTDPLGRVTGYTYEGRGLLASVTDPLGRLTTFGYDPCGRLGERTGPGGATVRYRYDPAGRPAGIEAPDAEPVAYTWDRAGRLVSVTDATGTTTFAYGGDGRPISEEHEPGGFRLDHTYDELGRRVRLELSRGGEPVAAWAHRFDPDGRITAVADPAGGETRLTYDRAGRLARVAHPNGVATTWSHDLVGQPTTLAVTGPTGAISHWALTHDDDGNRTRSTYQAGTSGPVDTTSYAYDDLGRLLRTEHTDGTEGLFSWDRVGNVNGPGSAYDAADQITADAQAAYVFDPAGNLTARLPAAGQDALAATYDSLGRTTGLNSGAEQVTFGYDGLGRRVTRASPQGTTRRVFDGANVIAEIDSAGGAVTLETTAGLLVLARHHPTGGNRYLHPDPTTSVAAVTDDTGTLLARYRYTPFGRKATTEGDPDAAGPLGYCGTLGVRQDAGELLDMRARLYDPRLGRFTTPDPWPAHLPEPLTLNRYLYALGDPISQVDPYGLFCLTGKNKHGKCRGLKDVVQKGGDVLEEPLGVVSTVATGVAAIAAGVSLTCPPCSVVSAPIAGFAGQTAFYTGVAGAAATCAADLSFSFDCAVGVASSGAGWGFRRLSKSIFEALGLHPVDAFAKGIFGVLRSGVKRLLGRIWK